MSAETGPTAGRTTYRALPEGTSELEEEVLERWRDEDTFRRSVREREGEPEYVFYEGPPTANGRPGVHHILARTIKDLVARYWTMRGRHVTRIAGWDTHGLPVEVEAEKELGISGKPEIEEIGIDRFVETCRQNLFTYQEEWEDLSRRIGYWLDYDDPYVTYHPDYIESVWWAVERIHEEGLLYQGYKSLPYCPRCGTGLSSHELAQGYDERRDPSLFTLFPVATEAPADGDGRGGDGPDRYLLTWTTTPWTLVSNVAVAFNPELEYVEVEARLDRRGERGRDVDDGAPARVLLSRRRAADLFRLEEGAGDEGAPRRPRGRIVRRVPAEELDGLEYRRPLLLDPGYERETGAVHPAEFVSDEEGTGLVHIAPAFGADDFELGRERNLPLVRPVDDDGRFESDVREVGGMPVKDADGRLIQLLGEKGRLFRADTTVHTYPHCWRCDTPLIYMARESWYVETTAVKDRLLEENATVDWHPPEVGSGRMGEWLENNVDWALSRDRFWGTPLPVWECDEGEHREVLGSFEQLAERADGLPEDFDPHRPEIDRIEWTCVEEGCRGTMSRVPQVMDAWFDSGSMPFAQWHYPFENGEEFRRHFPADIIAEGVDQTRGWFYSLLAISTIIFDRSPYREVVVNDLVLDAEGRKMSKSRGNTVDPWEAIDRYGADAIRLYLLTSSNPWLPKRWDPEGLAEVQRKLLNTLRNTYRFFSMYANLENWHHAGQRDGGEGAAEPPAERPVMDRWLLSRLDTVVRKSREDLEDSDLTRAARRLDDFVVDELSNWYVRRTRDRFWATGSTSERPLRPDDAFATLHEALRTTSLLLAPMAPFASDWLHRELGDGTSAHLADYPESRGRRRPALEQAMKDVRELAALGRAAREDLGLKVRQPLRRVEVVLPGGRSLPDALVRVLREELNVKRVAFPSESADIVRLHAKPDYSELGPRHGARTPDVAEAVEGLDGDRARRLRDGESVEVDVHGEPTEIRPRDVAVLESGRGEYAVRSEHGYMVALDPSLDEELREEGLAREVVSRVQRFRREAGLEVDDRIRLAVEGDRAVEEALGAHRRYVAGETLAVELSVGSGAGRSRHVTDAVVEGHSITIGLEREPPTESKGE